MRVERELKLWRHAQPLTKARMHSQALKSTRKHMKALAVNTVILGTLYEAILTVRTRALSKKFLQ